MSTPISFRKGMFMARSGVCLLVAMVGMGFASANAQSEILGSGGNGEKFGLRCWQNGQKIMEEKNLREMHVKTEGDASLITFSRAEKGKVYLYNARETTCLIEENP